MIKTYRQWIDNNLILKHPLNIKINTRLSLENYIHTIIHPMFQTFLSNYCIFIQKKDTSYPNLSIINYEIDTLNINEKPHTNKKQSLKSSKSNHYIYTAYTVPLNNHPFIVYGNINTSFCHIVIPLGNRLGHIDINDIYSLIPYFSKIELTIMREMLVKCIIIRQSNIIYNPKYSVMNCNIINECINKINEIENSLLITSEKKKELKLATETFYNDKIKILLDRFFFILGLGQYDDALKFLKGEYNRYFTMNGLSAIFINSKELIGHLQIFINLFHLYHTLRDYKMTL